MGVRKGLNSLEVIGKEISVDNRLWKHYPTELLPLSDFPIFICVTLQTTKDNLCFRVIFSYFIFIQDLFWIVSHACIQTFFALNALFGMQMLA